MVFALTEMQLLFRSGNYAPSIIKYIWVYYTDPYNNFQAGFKFLDLKAT